MSPDNGACSFRILGPVQIFTAGTPIGFARRQHLDLAAFLLLHAERVVTASQIIDAMWGEAALRTASVQVKNMLSALRGVLHGGGQSLATVDRQPAGYKLHLVSGHLDLSLFTARVAQARAAPSPADAAQLLRSALDLWQGTIPLAGVRAAFADAALPIGHFKTSRRRVARRPVEQLVR
jgi:DNA-binding SARP family transcriptional activator